jgi:hypothetical protein
MSERAKLWIELIKKRDQLEGTKITYKVMNLQNSQYILDKNYEDLLNLIEDYEKDLNLWSIEYRDKLDSLQKEMLRLLHNYSLSIFSLIEHTRNFLRDLNNEKLSEGHKLLVKELKIDEKSLFIQELRNFVQHYKLPFISARMLVTVLNQTGKGIYKQDILLDKTNLLDWKGWSRESRSYLENKKENIDLKEVVEIYHKWVKSFYTCFYELIKRLYAREINELIHLEDQIMILQKGMEDKS